MFSELTKLPGSPQLHRWADWAEVLCLSQGYLSIPDLSSEVEAREDVLEIEADDDIEPGLEVSDELVEVLGSAAEFHDATSQRASDTFALIATRSVAYGDSYPFEIDASGRRLKTRALRPDRLMYVFLLACATFRYVEKKRVQTLLAGRFEWLARYVLSLQMPSSAETHLFGANPEPGGRYDMPLGKRIHLLGSDIREKVLLDVEKEFPSGSGDNGLDLVSWVAPDDIAPGFMAVFAQCACTPQWVNKQHSSSVAAWNPLFRFTVTPLNYCFMPFDFRGTDGDWYARHCVQGSIVMDRRRVMKALGSVGSDGTLVDLPSELVGQLKLDEFKALVADLEWDTVAA